MRSLKTAKSVCEVPEKKFNLVSAIRQNIKKLFLNLKVQED